MGNYKKPSSSPEWKVLADEEADRYLHQSFFRKLEEEGSMQTVGANLTSMQTAGVNLTQSKLSTLLNPPFME